MLIVEKLFDAVRQYPDQTAEDYGVLVGCTGPSASSQLLILVRRGLLSRERKQRPPGKGSERHTSPFIYRAVREKYVSGYEHSRRQRELQKKREMRKSVAPEAAPVLPTPKVEPAPVPVAAPAPAPVAAPVLDIDNMTVGEAKRIYAQLQEFFKNK
jgi:hypothetical protein